MNVKHVDVHYLKLLCQVLAPVGITSPLANGFIGTAAREGTYQEMGTRARRLRWSFRAHRNGSSQSHQWRATKKLRTSVPKVSATRLETVMT